MFPGFNLGLKGHQECLDRRECQDRTVDQVNRVNPVNMVDLAFQVLQAREDLQEVIHQVDILATHPPLCPMEGMQRWWIQSLEEILLKKRKTMY